MATHRKNGGQPEYVARKPLSITPEGKLLFQADLEARGAQLALSLTTLETSLQQKLTTARIKPDPNYNLGVLGMGLFKKDEILDNVSRLTEFGQNVIQAEMNYCEEHMAELGLTKKPKTAKSTRVTIEPVVIPPWKANVKRIKLAVKNTVLFCENNTDAVTKNAATWRIANVHNVFAGRGFKVVSLTGTDDVRPNFLVEAKKPYVVYIGGIGHGSPTLYTGNLGDHLLDVGMYDPAEVKGKSMHFLSCKTAQQLGPNVITKGARAYGGYYQNFTFVWDVAGTAVNEEVLFYQSDGTFDQKMALGFTVEQAANATIAAFNAARLLPGIPGTAAATWLTWDRDWFRSPVANVIYGDKLATISPYTYVWIPIPLSVSELEAELEKA